MRGPTMHDENRGDLRSRAGKTVKPTTGGTRKVLDENRSLGKGSNNNKDGAKESTKARLATSRTRSALTALPTQTQSAPATAARGVGGGSKRVSATPAPTGTTNVGRLPRLKSSTASSTGARAPGLSATTAPLRPREPRTPPRAAPPKTPADQVGAAGAVRAAILAKRRPIAMPETAPRKPKVTRSISVLADDPSAGPSAIDAPHAPSPKRSAVAATTLAHAFPGDDVVAEPSAIDFPDFPDVALPELDEPPSPPSPRYGAFGGDDFQFDLI